MPYTQGIQGVNMDKKATESKTMWFNGLTIAAVIIATLINHELIVENPLVVSVLGVVQAAVNMGLRYITNTGISK